jgi:hypothetical protein
MNTNTADINTLLETQAAQAEYVRQHEAMKAMLSRIAYPRRGTSDETMDIFEAAKLIQETFNQEALSPTLPDPDLGNIAEAHTRMWHREALRLAEKHQESTFYNPKVPFRG